jgi:hypothetical protein
MNGDCSRYNMRCLPSGAGYDDGGCRRFLPTLSNETPPNATNVSVQTPMSVIPRFPKLLGYTVYSTRKKK